MSDIARGVAQSEFVGGLVPTGTSGVLATTPTALGSQLISERLDDENATESERTAGVDSVESKVSVFDGAAQIQLDAVVDDLAEDTASTQADEDNATDALDQVFAEL